MNKAPVANFNAVCKILTLGKYLETHELKTHRDLQHRYCKGEEFLLPFYPHLPGTRLSLSPLPSGAIQGLGKHQ